MKIAILGASGQTGLEAVKQALADGHKVTAVVRNPIKIRISHPKLNVIEVDVFDEEALQSTFDRQDAVISCLGFPPKEPAVNEFLEVTKVVVTAMKSASVSRLVVCHSWFTEPESRSKSHNKTLIPKIKTVLDNMYQTELWLHDEADVDFTVVRPGGLTDGAVTDAEFKVAEGEYYVEGIRGRIARSDVARFMLSVLKDQKYYKKEVAIAV